MSKNLTENKIDELIVAPEVTMFKDVWRRIRDAHGRYRQCRWSLGSRKWFQARNTTTMLAFAGVAVTIGGVVTAIVAAQAQISAVDSGNPAGLFDYSWFDFGFGILAAGATWGLIAASAIGSQAAARRQTPFEIQVDYNVYSHEKKDNLPRRLRVRVVNNDPYGVTNVSVKVMGGSDATEIRTAGYLREFDDSFPYADSRQGVSIPGGQQRYFLLAEQVEGEKFLTVGFINQELVKENPLPFPTMVEGKESFVYLMVDGRSAKDGAFVRPEYVTIKIVQHHDIPGLEEGPRSIRWYDGILTATDRERIP